MSERAGTPEDRDEPDSEPRVSGVLDTPRLPSEAEALLTAWPIEPAAEARVTARFEAWLEALEPVSVDAASWQVPQLAPEPGEPGADVVSRARARLAREGSDDEALGRALAFEALAAPGVDPAGG